MGTPCLLKVSQVRPGPTNVPFWIRVIEVRMGAEKMIHIELFRFYEHRDPAIEVQSNCVAEGLARVGEISVD